MPLAVNYKYIHMGIRYFWYKSHEPVFLHSQKMADFRRQGLGFKMLAPKFRRRARIKDLVAQLVEHNTFNVGALGSSPSGITEV